MSDCKQQQKAAASAAGKFDPNPLYRAKPAYPAGARASKIEGAVTNVRVVSASPPGVFKRFRVAENAEKGIDAVTGTDGVALTTGNFGPDYAEGLLVVQDDDNAGAAQNFKLVSWAAVRSRLNAGQ